jgi:hypothetical protein
LVIKWRQGPTDRKVGLQDNYSRVSLR